MKGSVLRIFLAVSMLMSMLGGPQAFAHLSTPPNAVAMSGKMDCCPGRHEHHPPTCPKCPLMALCASPYIDDTRALAFDEPFYSVRRRAVPVDEGGRPEVDAPPLPEPPRSRG